VCLISSQAAWLQGVQLVPACARVDDASAAAATPALTQVKLGLEEVACDLFRVKPYVYSSPDSSAAIVFSGQ
jgi:hypothetical protein